MLAYNYRPTHATVWPTAMLFVRQNESVKSNHSALVGLEKVTAYTVNQCKTDSVKVKTETLEYRCTEEVILLLFSRKRLLNL